MAAVEIHSPLHFPTDATLAATRLRQSPKLSDTDSYNKACCWQATCYIANVLQHMSCPLNRRVRERFFFAAGVLSLAVWLFMAVAEICTPVHAWLHGGSIPDNDDCAIVAISHGKVHLLTVDVPVVAPTTFVEAPPVITYFISSATCELLPLGRAPPAPSSVS